MILRAPVRMLRWGLLALLLLASGGLAQSTTPQIDFDRWTRLAERAERVVDASRASTPALEEMRAQLVQSRTLFSAAETANSARITSLQAQLEVLGAAPEVVSAPEPVAEDPAGDGTSEGDALAQESTAPPESAPVFTLVEPPEITARRVELVEQLVRAQAPGLRAQEAFRRAEGLIREIDAIIRDRQTEELLERGPTPLSYVAWGEALSALQSTATNIWSESSRLAISPMTGPNGDEGWLETLLFLLLAIVIVARGRHWVGLLTRWLARQDVRGQPIATLLASLGEILVPYVGILALVAALTATGLLGARGSFILDQVPFFALIFFSARWLGGQVFSARTPYFDLSVPVLREGRFYASMIGLVLALEHLFHEVIAFESYAPGAAAVIEGVLIALGALFLLRIGFILLKHAGKSDDGQQDAVEEEDILDPEEGGIPAPSHGIDPGAEASLRRSVERVIGRACVGIAIFSPIAAAIGYAALAAFLIFPMLTSLGLLWILMVLNRLTRQIYGAIRNVSPEAVQTALWPILVDVVFWLGALPLFALIWGVRVSDLTELWTRFLVGVSFGGARISPSNFLTFAVVFAALFAATRLVQGALRTTVLPKTKIDPGGQVALISGLGYVGVFLAALVAITAAGIDLSNLALVAGALSIGIGFGLQTIVSNFVAGIILLIERPVAEGDWIEVNGTMGFVRDISVRSTRIETFDRTDVIVPNADLISGMVTNWTRGNLTGRVIVPIGVAYGNDTRRIERILREIAEAHPMVILRPPPAVHFRGFGADSLDFEIRAILRDINWMLAVQSDLNHAIAGRFEAEGIEIPFAQRDVWLRNPEALQGPKTES